MDTTIRDGTRQQASTSRVRAPSPFYRFDHALASYPMPARGESRRLDRLSAQEKALLSVIAGDFFKQGSDPRCRRLDEDLGRDIGLTGDGTKIKRKVRALIHGRPDRDKRIPGLVEKGFLVIHPDPDPYNHSRRAIEVTGKLFEPGSTRAEVGARRAEVGAGRAEVGAGRAPTRAPRATPLIGREGEGEGSSSSAGAGATPGDDDDDFRSATGGDGDGDGDGGGGPAIAEALAAVEREHGQGDAGEIRAAVPELGAAIRAAVPELGSELVWACVALAIFRAAEKPKGGFTSSARGFVWKAAVNFAKSTPPYDPGPDLDRARKKFAPAPPAPAEDLGRWEEIARAGPDHPDHPRARQRAIDLRNRLAGLGWGLCRSPDGGPMFDNPSPVRRSSHKLEPFKPLLKALRPIFVAMLDEEDQEWRSTTTS